MIETLYYDASLTSINFQVCNPSGQVQFDSLFLKLQLIDPLRQCLNALENRTRSSLTAGRHVLGRKKLLAVAVLTLANRLHLRIKVR
jgi:hypothetical protein